MKINPDHQPAFSVFVRKQVYEDRMAQIKAILSRGNIVRFTMEGTDITKDVKEWNAGPAGGEHEDLKAFRFENAQTPFVAWHNPAYLISEIAGEQP